MIRKRFKACVDAEADLRAKAADDFKFAWVSGHQWDNHFGAKRGDRPKYEFNKLRQAIKQVINDNRQNTPAIKVRATEDGDTELASIRQGLIRNIESESKADEAYDWGALYAITAGFGAWRVVTEYVGDDAFDQDIRIRRIPSPLTSVWFDPSARELDRSDARFAFVVESVSRDEFRERWPNADCVDFEGSSEYGDWFGQKEVRIAEYWSRKPVKREMLQLSDGRVVAADDWTETEGVEVVNRRKVDTFQLTMEIVSGKETLEGPFDWPTPDIPIIPVWGDIVTVDGSDQWSGMVRPARDAQVLYNFERSNFAEVIATQPHAPFLYTPKQIEGFEREWAGLATDNAPGLPYNPDPQAESVAPRRQPPPQMSPGYMAALQLSSDDLKAVTGIYDASLGARSNETSGRAIMARKQEGDVANFDYADNIARAVRRTGEIVNRLIPEVYNGERQIRILGEDGAEKYVRINHLELDEAAGEWRSVTGRVVNEDGSLVPVYDITQGKYDVTIATGPSYTTQRMETLDAMMQLAQSNGPMAMLAQYGMLKSMDTPGMEETLEAMRRVLVGQGLLPPSEEDQAQMQPQQPDPVQESEVAENMAGAEKDKAMAIKYAADAEKTQMEIQRQMYLDQVALAPPIPQPQPLPMEPPPGGFFVGQ
nr:portal protein [Lysobacter sp. GX 14042]